jgi:hypothetical protein
MNSIYEQTIFYQVFSSFHTKEERGVLPRMASLRYITYMSCNTSGIVRGKYLGTSDDL